MLLVLLAEGLRAETADDTLLFIDSVGKQVFANARRALLFVNVSLIFISEEFKGRENGIGSSLTETAGRIRLDVVAELLESVKILGLALAACDLVKQFKKASCSYAAGSTLAAGFVNSEIKEEFCYIDHTGIFIHNDETT